MRLGGTVKLLAIVTVCAVLLTLVHFIGSRMTPRGPVTPGAGRGVQQPPAPPAPVPGLTETDDQRAARLLAVVRDSATISPLVMERLHGRWAVSSTFISMDGEVSGTSLIYDFVKVSDSGTIRYTLVPAGVRVNTRAASALDGAALLAPLSGEAGGVLTLETTPGAAFIVFAASVDGEEGGAPGRLRRFMATEAEAGAITLIPTIRDLADMREQSIVVASMTLQKLGD